MCVFFCSDAGFVVCYSCIACFVTYSVLLYKIDYRTGCWFFRGCSISFTQCTPASKRLASLFDLALATLTLFCYSDTFSTDQI